MADLRYENWAPNRGINSADLNDGFAWPLANMALAMKLFMGGGLYRGGRVKQTTVASKNVIVEPLAGVGPTNELLVLDGEVTLAVPDNASIYSRLDLVSVVVQTIDAAPVSRAFWNPSTKVAFTQNTTASKSLRAVPTYTVGVPSGSPVAPALPANHVALATVLVGPGFTTVVDANITRSLAPEPLQIVTFDGPGGLNSLPYEPAQEIKVSIRAGGLAFVFAQVTFNDGNSFSAEVSRKLLLTTIEEVGGASVAERKDRLFQGDTRGLFLGGPVVGPKTLARFKLRFADGGSTGDPFGNVNISGKCLFGAVTL